jgi:hypothetical protein
MSKKQFIENLDNMVELNFDQNETLQQLQMNRSIFWSWGVSNMFRISDTALMLRVNGYIHKGWVMITLGWNDTYTYRLLNKQYNEVYKETDVYCDMLVERIDEKIEKQPNYVF